jgi:pimeloyl-ACP methyl ester carboxylesterase
VPKNTSARKESNQASTSPEQLISGKWLLSALGIVIGAALISAYATLCLLFYQGSWQLIFHPSRTISATPSIPYQEIQFDYTETGKPRLTGWWIPAETNASYANSTILYLHDGRGSLSDTITQLESLQALGINVLAFDYRGFGKSADLHPSETSLNDDADAALAYLTGTRHLTTRSVIVYGTGIGAAPAASFAARHPEIAAVILENISPTATTIFAADARTKILPVHLLTSDHFDATEQLKTLQTPKLFLSRNNAPQTHAAFSIAGAPKQFFEIGSDDPAKFQAAMHHFLDEVLSHQ